MDSTSAPTRKVGWAETDVPAEGGSTQDNDGVANVALGGDASALAGPMETLALTTAGPSRGVFTLGHMFNFHDYPDEVYLHILAHLESRKDLFNCAMACKKLGELMLESYVWETQCRLMWPDPLQNRALLKDYENSYLRMFQTRHFLRFEGVFVWRSGYHRRGWTEGAWVQPTLAVTFYRYLRFFPDGTFLFSINSDDPHEFIYTLKKSNHKHVHHGTWWRESDGVIRTTVLVGESTVNMELHINSTKPAANNRLLVVKHTLTVRGLPREQDVRTENGRNRKFYFQKLREELLQVV